MFTMRALLLISHAFVDVCKIGIVLCARNSNYIAMQQISLRNTSKESMESVKASKHEISIVFNVQ